MKNRYPRPQMKRDSFQSLDGEWLINGEPGQVPSCRKEEHLHYEKTFAFKRENARTLLHIDAADQVAEVYLNGSFIGKHEGGYLPFTYDVSLAVHEGANRLEINVADALDHKYPYGKQTKKPSGMWYTPVSGIWKSVWLEQVPDVYISSVKITPDLRGADAEVISSAGVHTFERFEPDNPELWTPDNPKLYTARISQGEDSVEIYYALRTVEIKSVGGTERLCLNGEPVFINGVLDQGYWPETLFIPDTANGYEQDILRMKELGFNLLRKHIKIEDEEFYYQCDRLGMLVMQDMVQTGRYSFLRDTVLPTAGINISDRVSKLSPAQRFFISHSEETVKHLYSHPCIIAWTIFNEGWGQFNSDEMYSLFKSWDTTRPADSASGWFAQKNSDFESLHIYFRLADLKPGRRPLLVSECGGYSFSAGNGKIKWGYGRCRDSEALTDRIIELYNRMIIPKIKAGVCGVIYTQLSDVEGEMNGLYTFDRKCKVNKKRLSACMAELQNYLKQDASGKSV